MKPKAPHHPPTVNLYVDANHAYGRGILRGILRYANLRRRWKIQIDWSGLFRTRSMYPDCDGSIVAEIAPEDCRAIQTSAGHIVNCSTSDAAAGFPTVHADNTLAGRRKKA